MQNLKCIVAATDFSASAGRAVSRAELIVLGREGRGGLEKLLLGSVSKDVVQAAECDVLVAGTD